VTGCDDFRIRFGYWVDRAAGGEELLVTRRGKPRIRVTPATPPPQRPAPTRPQLTLLPAPRTPRIDQR